MATKTNKSSDKTTGQTKKKAATKKKAPAKAEVKSPKKTASKAVKKTTAAKKPPVKKSDAKKAPVKKVSAKKTATKKVVAKPPIKKAGQKAPAKTAAIKKTPVKTKTAASPPSHGGESRRDFLYLTAGAFGAVGAASVAWPFIDSLNPAADTLALATVEVNLTPVEKGQAITVMWQGKPVFIRHRTAAEIEKARAVDLTILRDKQTDEDRVQKPEWLVMVGICTHLGCVPLGQKPTDPKGDYAGWFCPCHGSHYDEAGRIRKGPAPKNMMVPEYKFTNDTTIIIG